MSQASRVSEPLIAVQNASKTYRDGHVRALDRVSLSIHSGEFLAIMGPSGSGKSTLLNLIGALDLPSEGEVFFRGQSLKRMASLDRLRATEIGFVFQSFYLLPNLTAEENVQLPMFEGRLGTGARVLRARELLTRVGLADRMRHLPEQLSNGQRQRVAIARALANEPAVVLADEPTGALDSTSGAEVMQLLVDLNVEHGTTLVVVTHDQSVADRSRRIVRMMDGRITEHPEVQ
jgi:ABC-type lipoprotein export system ATPase subunit